MRKVLMAVMVAAALTIFWAAPALAAPNESASHVGRCAVEMGGGHVAECARTMEQGVSTCAEM
jgi:hypothetical protein